MSYEVEIVKALSKLGTNGTVNPDSKHNQGRLLGEAFMWDAVEKYAKGKSEAAWKALEKEGICPDKESLLPGSETEFAYSPSFVGTVTVTQPVKRFDGETLAVSLSKSKYKVPVSVTKELINDAKVPTKPMVKFKIIERS